MTNHEVRVNVSKKLENKLNSLENWGGFKRFDICLYDINVSAKKSDKLEIIDFLLKVFINVTRDQITKLINA